METYEEQILAGFDIESLSCLRAFPANRLPLPGSDEARAMTVGSGRQCAMWLEQSSPLGAFSRTLLESSRWTRSEEYCYVWERLDTRFGCSAFQLTPLGQSTEDNGCLLWRTPTGTEDDGGGDNGQRRLEQGHALRLRDQIKTPSLWPTPTVQDGANNSGPSQHNRNSDPLNVVAAKICGQASGSLNPDFVEWLMGFQIGHTRLRKPLTKEKKKARTL